MKIYSPILLSLEELPIKKEHPLHSSTVYFSQWFPDLSGVPLSVSHYTTSIPLGWSLKPRWRVESLTLPRRKSLSHRNQSTDLLWKLMDWFLYNSDLRHERVKPAWVKITMTFFGRNSLTICHQSGLPN